MCNIVSQFGGVNAGEAAALPEAEKLSTICVENPVYNSPIKTPNRL
jgi:hypothetical protein